MQEVKVVLSPGTFGVDSVLSPEFVPRRKEPMSPAGLSGQRRGARCSMGHSRRGEAAGGDAGSRLGPCPEPGGH